jgi:hypothetical protein
MRFALTLLIAGSIHLLAADAADEKAVIDTVQRLFDAMKARDSKLAASVLMPEGRYASVLDDGSITGATHAEFLTRLSTAKAALLERMWNPKVQIHGPIATLWTQYDFHRDGKFSHCGVDAFNLVKTPEGWKIAGFVYTVERTGCPASPLGPPPAE